MDSLALDRQLYLARKSATHKIRAEKEMREGSLFYVCSLSSQLLVYKGMLTPEQVFQFFDDLNDPAYETHLAMVHSRFSTNTFPSWDRAQPSRFMSHNGEINTLLGNVNAMNAREGNTHSEFFGNNIKKLFPIIEPNCSDSGSFDNVLEFLIMNGRSIPEALMMMVPEAWQQHQNMSQQKKSLL
jgi:glutamate synthase (NADPH/NADH) large chain